MISTHRLVLIPFDDTYSNDLYQIWSDPDVVQYTNTPLLSSKAECDIRAKRWADEFTDPVIPNNMLVLLNGKAIGIIGFSIMDKATAEFGLFYQFNKAYWHNGYATESTKAFIAYIERHYPNSTLFAECIRDHHASISILKKLGFIPTTIEKDKATGLDLIQFRYQLN